VSSSKSSSPKRRTLNKGNTLYKSFSCNTQQPTPRKRLHKKKNSAGESSDSDSYSDPEFNCTVKASDKNRIGFLNPISPRSSMTTSQRRSIIKSKSLSESSTFINSSHSNRKNDDDNNEHTTTTTVGELKQGPTSFNNTLTLKNTEKATSSLSANNLSVSTQASTNNLNSSLAVGLATVVMSSSRKRASSELDFVPKKTKLEQMPNSVTVEDPTPVAGSSSCYSGGKPKNKLLENVINATTGGVHQSDTDSSDSAQPLKIVPATFTKDSGFSSCSSQDLGSPTQEIDSATLCDSQETYCSELHDDNDGTVAKQEGGSSDRASSGTLLEQMMDQKNLYPSSLSRNSSSLSDYAFPGSSQNSESGFGSQLVDVTKSDLGLCMVCLVNPKDGGFVHKRKVHLCCCYKCANLIWKQRKTCPICNGKVMNVVKVFAH
jgi:hypothetical protein